MKYLIVPIILIISACATTTPPIPADTPVEEIVPEIVTQELSDPIADMLIQARKCPGVVTFTAIYANDKPKARFSCSWDLNEQLTETW